MNEDKVREAIAILDERLVCKASVIHDARVLLEKAIAPEQPEIPEGCPVIVNTGLGGDDIITFMGQVPIICHEDDITIDYQRKGHVIPWHGGECPVDDQDAYMTVFTANGPYNVASGGARWGEVSHAHDIIAYVIWPEWVKP